VVFLRPVGRLLTISALNYDAAIRPAAAFDDDLTNRPFKQIADKEIATLCRGSGLPLINIIEAFTARFEKRPDLADLNQVRLLPTMSRSNVWADVVCHYGQFARPPPEALYSVLFFGYLSSHERVEIVTCCGAREQCYCASG
jgi:hypothetical protein